MKYDRDTMKSLQEAYASVNETYKGARFAKSNRNKQTGNPPISNRKNTKPKDEGIKNQKELDQMRKGLGAGSDINDLNDSYFPEEQEHEGMKYSDKKKLQRQKQLADKQKEAPVVKNKIVPMKTRTEEAIKMSRKEYNKTHKDFKSDDKKNPRVTRYVPGKGTVSTPVELTDEVNKENCGCGETPCKTYGQKKAMDDKMKEVDDMRSLPTRMNLIKTKLRAMGLNMSHELKGKELSEVIDYTLTERNRYEKETGIDTKTGKKIVKGGTAKNDLAFQAVMRDHQDERMGANQKKKKRGAKTDEGTGKFLKMQNKKKQTADQTAADAKKRGFDNVQNYVDTMARYGGKKNYDSGKGLGS